MSGDSNVVVHLPPSSSSGNGHAAMDRHLHSRYDKQGSKKSKSSNQKTREMIKFVWFVLLYYFSNSFVVLTNKQLISMMGFKFPIFLTCMHMTATVFLSYLMLDVWEVFQKQAVSSKKQRTNITLLAVMFAVSLLCGNWSLKYIHVSFMQMIGASTPFFVCILGYIFFNTVYPWRVYATLVPIAGGAMISTYGEGNLSLFGFVLQLIATFSRGLKTVWQGYLLQGEEKLSSPNLLRYMAFDSAVILFVSAVLMEGSSFLSWMSSERPETYGFWYFALLLTVNPLSAYLANYTQFMLIQISNPLTFQVIGNTKGLINVICSIIVFPTK